MPNRLFSRLRRLGHSPAGCPGRARTRPVPPRSAVQDRLVASSPVTRLSLPRSERERIVPLTVRQVRSLAEAMPARCRAMVIAQAGLGLRVAELLALRVQDVDFLRRTVRVEWQTKPRREAAHVPKTPRSRRTVPLPGVVAEALASHLAEFPAADDGSLFTTPSGMLYRHEHYGARVSPPRSVGLGCQSERRATTYAITSPRCCWPPANLWWRSPNGWATRTPRLC